MEAVHENHERWLLTYADMITLLVAFFIMLYGISRIEQEKLDRFKNGVQTSLGIASGGRSPIGQGETAGAHPDVVAGKLSPAQKIHARMEEFVRREKLQSQVRVTLDPDGAIIRLTSGGMLFDAGTAELKPRTREILEALFAAIRPEIADNTIRKIRVEGHTDNVPIQTAHFPSNWQLSTTRATNVVQYLAERHPLLTPRLEAAGCADIRPLAANDSPGGRAKNRRVEIRVLQRTSY
jgi:chemotaxis protein MotB